MFSISELWKIWIEANGTNNVAIRKARREGFRAGAEAMRDQMNENSFSYDVGDARKQLPLQLIDGGLSDE